MISFKISAVLAILATAATTSAAALPNQVTSRVFNAALEFWGADTPEAGGPPTSYSLSVPVDDNVFVITNTLSVSKISSVGGAICTIFGADGSQTFSAGEETVDVGPPQPQVSGICDNE
ncbi:hypothetical protein MMC14_000664 [Varicellaria rhodocarpa]|nr:hypothetical protein [Varicellaria rhodocarpa]